MAFTPDDEFPALSDNYALYSAIRYTSEELEKCGRDNEGKELFQTLSASNIAQELLGQIGFALMRLMKERNLPSGVHTQMELELIYIEKTLGLKLILP
jgi:hypothetical protein